MKRRTFMRCIGCGAVATAVAQTELLPEFLGGMQNACAFDYSENLASVEARYYKKLDGGGVECQICPRHCMVTDLERGYCGTRENRDGTYYTLVYGKACALNIDPIEKKPLYHFHPGTTALSVATAGCNCNCKFCQNWDISQSRPEQTKNFDLSPDDMVEICRTRSVPNIAYTYSEPVIFYEYMYDTAKRAHEAGIKSVMITGGYIDDKPLAELLPHLDAVKVDLKGIREAYYRDVVGAKLQPVLDRLVQIRRAGVWLELVYLVVPTLNDSDAEFTDLARWIKANLGTDVPVHFSKFHPQYLLKNLPATPLATLERAYDVSRAEGLEYVYVGNVPGHRTESTFCPGCGEVVIERKGYRVRGINIDGNACRSCSRTIPGIF
ncbi:MAG: AmmeMemoRadiSam system radical SAM enzyme [candidate division Zixibacteria bacterium]|nr:AmmeMemoRadiSam system radical SAM enzyme [candidate division Zixibacteria bacterium]